MLLGGGTASAAAASTLRHRGFDGRVVLISDEEVPPYERPPLSKEVLAGTMSPSDTAIRGEEWYGANDVELLLGARATAVDVDGASVAVDGVGRIRYDHLLVATGGRARRLPGINGERVQHLRTQKDSERIASGLRDRGPIAVLGGGFIGCEVAATARELGVEVTIIEVEPYCLRGPLGDRYGSIMTGIHRDRGCRMRMGERVTAVTETSDGLVVTTDRRMLECDWMLVAAGMIPNTESVHETRIETDGGILVDGRCRTSIPNVYAAGDVAARRRRGGALRVEHHDNAMRQGAVAARNMMGDEVIDDEPHWFWSDQYDLSVQSLGEFDPYAHHVIRGSIEERSFSAFQLTGDGAGELCIEAVLTIGRPRDVFAARKLMRAGIPLKKEQIEDLSTDLRRLARPRRRR